jgi:hypothetical protein
LLNAFHIFISHPFFLFPLNGHPILIPLPVPRQWQKVVHVFWSLAGTNALLGNLLPKTSKCFTLSVLFFILTPSI